MRGAAIALVAVGSLASACDEGAIKNDYEIMPPRGAVKISASEYWAVPWHQENHGPILAFINVVRIAQFAGGSRLSWLEIYYSPYGPTRKKTLLIECDCSAARSRLLATESGSGAFEAHSAAEWVSYPKGDPREEYIRFVCMEASDRAGLANGQHRLEKSPDEIAEFTFQRAPNSPSLGGFEDPFRSDEFEGGSGSSE